MENCTFTPETITMNGLTFPAGYSIPPHGDGSVTVFITLPSKAQPVMACIAPDHPHHAAAMAAAEGYNAMRKQGYKPQPVQPVAVQEEKPQEQDNADDKKARGPVPEKTWIGTSIQGNGWKIEFCPIMERTRLIFDRIPTKEAREVVKAAGFAWSPKMGSWNKGLTWKAYRAAQKLAADLNGLSRRAC